MNYINTSMDELKITPLNKWEHYLWIAATILLAIDVATTWYVVSLYGVVAESNPLMADVISKYGVFGLLASKVVVVAFGFGFREMVSSHRWVLPFGVIIPALPVAIINVTAVAILL